MTAPTEQDADRKRQRCGGGVVLDEADRLLLVRRGHAPHAGTWSLPSGRSHDGEPPAATTEREVLEETGLVVRAGALLGVVERLDPDRPLLYEIHDYACEVLGGTLQAGDDAAEVAWVPLDRVRDLPLAPQLADALVAFGVLPPG
jgi:ADP-ribose pyrophosphatase YjhB (NUDIX family)